MNFEIVSGDYEMNTYKTTLETHYLAVGNEDVKYVKSFFIKLVMLATDKRSAEKYYTFK